MILGVQRKHLITVQSKTKTKDGEFSNTWLQPDLFKRSMILLQKGWSRWLSTINFVQLSASLHFVTYMTNIISILQTSLPMI